MTEEKEASTKTKHCCPFPTDWITENPICYEASVTVKRAMSKFGALGV